MKKIVLNISDTDYELFRFEAIEQRKDISEILRERIFERSFSKEVKQSFDEWLEKSLHQIMNE